MVAFPIRRETYSLNIFATSSFFTTIAKSFESMIDVRWMFMELTDDSFLIKVDLGVQIWNQVHLDPIGPEPFQILRSARSCVFSYEKCDVNFSCDCIAHLVL